MLLGTGTYRGAPFPKHAVLPVEEAHFDRWLELFLATVDENFSGAKADEAKGRALSIADTFARRMGVLAPRTVLLQPYASWAAAGRQQPGQLRHLINVSCSSASQRPAPSQKRIKNSKHYDETHHFSGGRSGCFARDGGLRQKHVGRPQTKG